MSTGLHIELDPRKKRIVIVGGGFAGLKLARKVDCDKFQVILIDRNNYHQFQPLFYQVSTAGLEPSAIAFPFRKILRKREDVYFRTCEALKVHPEEMELETSIGKIRYDFLVIATGCDTNYFGNKELQKSTMSLKSISEALYARNVILENWEQALNEDTEADQKKDLSVVIVGGGPTGVELAGTLAEMRRDILPKDYPELNLNEMKIHLVEAGSKLLGGMKPFASDYAKEKLSQMGVLILLNTKVTGYENEKVLLEGKDPLPAKNVLWVAGVVANGLPGLPESAYGKGHRVIVNEFNQSVEDPNIFVIGDTALMKTKDYPDGHPQLAPTAIQQGKHLAKNIALQCAGRPMIPFKYRNKGVMATIGRNKAVVELPFMRMKGFFAWATWLFVHLMSILGGRNKLIVFIGWAANYFTRDPSLRVLIKPKVKKS
jgi:NADH:ubiquinone reductase (H+-translocating)